MPELPEVETVKRKLSSIIIGKTIKEVKIFYDKYKDIKDLKNEKINDIKRKGKYLIFVLDNFYLISHLRMEGKYFIRKSVEEFDKHDLVHFYLDDFILAYNDTRKFGVFNLFSKDTDIYNIEPLVKVGDEPFFIDYHKLYESIKIKKDPIKTILLDQSIMSGLGNIYVDEVLFMSHINPFRKGITITLDDAKNIKENSIIVLNKAIEKGGSTIRTYASLDGEIGHFQLDLLVHMKEGQRCPVCNNYIIKTRCGGRGTYICESCQRLNKNTKIYGITGSYSSGKSTVLKIIKELGYETYSLDDIYKDLFINNKDMLKEIKKNLKVDTKEELKEIVFNDEKKNDILKNITHKYIMKELFNKINSSLSIIIFVEAPLLFEGGFEKTFDKVICVNESEEISKKLFLKKGVDEKEYIRRINSQYSKEYKLNHSDYIINNFGSLNDLKNETKKLIKELTK